jgi:hypothetical protein
MRKGKYIGTVPEGEFMVPFSHCPGSGKKAEWGCVGKVRAVLISSVVDTLRHPADTTRQI